MATFTATAGPKIEATGTSISAGSDGARVHTGAPDHISGIQYGTRPMAVR